MLYGKRLFFGIMFLVSLVVVTPDVAMSEDYSNLQYLLGYALYLGGVKILAEGTSIASDLLNELGEAVMECQSKSVGIKQACR